jgi:hypothetical protein
MRALKVFENIEFERGKDPKDSLFIGRNRGNDILKFWTTKFKKNVKEAYKLGWSGWEADLEALDLVSNALNVPENSILAVDNYSISEAEKEELYNKANITNVLFGPYYIKASFAKNGLIFITEKHDPFILWILGVDYRLVEDIGFQRGGNKAEDIGVGVYKEMRGMPEEIKQTVLLLREMGYFRPEYEKGFQYRTEETYSSKQFFWDYSTGKQYTWSGAKILWASLFSLDLKTPDKFYNDHPNIRNLSYEIGGEISFYSNLHIQKIDPNSEASKYYGGPILAEITLRGRDPLTDEDLIDLPKSYTRMGIKDTEELIFFISKKLKDLEIYVKRFLNNHYKNSFSIEESYEFKRGKDPRDILKIGDVYGRMMKNVREEISEALQKLADEFGGRVRVYKLQPWDGKPRIKGLWTPGPEKHSFNKGDIFYNYGIEAFIANDEKLYFSPEIQKSGSNEWSGNLGSRETALGAADTLRNEFLRFDSRSPRNR